MFQETGIGSGTPNTSARMTDLQNAVETNCW